MGLVRNMLRAGQRGYILLLVPVILVGISVLAIRSMDRSRAAIRIAGSELNYVQTGMCVQQCAALAVNSSEKALNDNLGVSNHSETCSCNPADHEAISCSSDFNSVVDSGISNCYGMVMNRTTMDISVNCKKQSEAAQTVQENVGFSEYPIFQFAVFFQKNLEFTPGALMSVTGRVHSNDTVFLCPAGGYPTGNLFLYDWITSPLAVAGRQGVHSAAINFPRMDGSGVDEIVLSGANYQSLDQIIPNWSSWKKAHRVAYGDQASSCGKVKPLTVPLRDTANMHALVDWRNSPVTDDPDLKSQKFAWRADLIYKNGWYNNDMTAAPLVNPIGLYGAAWTGKATVDMTTHRVHVDDGQEGVTVKLIPIDLSRLRQRPGDDVIYLYDSYLDAGQGNKDVGGFLLYNGAVQTRPITIVSNSRIFMWGDFNTSKTYMASGFGLQPYPAAIISDLYVQLSNEWNGNKDQCCGGNYVAIRVINPAEVTTLNACVMSGMVVGANGKWQGAYQNFLHFIEDFGGTSFVFTGSSVALWGSKLHYGSVSTTYYHPPNRDWSFAPMYKKMANMPPATPRVVEPQLNTWEMARH